MVTGAWFAQKYEDRACMRIKEQGADNGPRDFVDVDILKVG